MARPKMTAQAARSITNFVLAQTAELAKKNVQAVGEEPKRPAKLEDGRMVYMRVKNPLEENHGCVDDDPSSSSDVEVVAHIPAPRPLQATTAQIQQENGDDGKPREQFDCTACGRSVHVSQVVPHPLLLVGVCTACHDFLFSSPFTKDSPDEHENECRWCGDGGDMVLCDFCPRSFCKACIERNSGASFLHAIESPAGRWPCFVCENRPLHPAIHECKKLESLQQQISRSLPPPKRRSSLPPPNRRRNSLPPPNRRRNSLPPPKRRSSQPPEKRRRIREDGEPRRLWSRSRSIINKTWKTCSSDDTIATIIARAQAQMKKENPGKHFTGFEAPDPLRCRRPIFRRQHDFTSEHDTINGGAIVPSSGKEIRKKIASLSIPMSFGCCSDVARNM